MADAPDAPNAPDEPDEIRFRVRPWWDPGLAVRGHDPLGDHLETWWLPVLGPSATLALRCFTRGLRAHPEGFEVGLAELSAGLGLGSSRGRNSPAARAVQRLVRFGLAREADALEVRTHVPELPEHLRRRLPRQVPGWQADGWQAPRRQAPGRHPPQRQAIGARGAAAQPPGAPGSSWGSSGSSPPSQPASS